MSVFRSIHFIPTMSGAERSIAAPNSKRVMGLRVSFGNQKEMGFADRNLSNSHRICSSSAFGSSGKVSRRGLKTVIGSSWSAVPISLCQSGQLVIPPARKTLANFASSLFGLFTIAYNHCTLFKFRHDNLFVVADYFSLNRL